MPKRFVVAASEFSDLPRFAGGFDLAEALTEAAQQLHETPTPHGTLRTAVQLAVHLMPGAEHAGVSVIERSNRPRTLAWTDEVVRSAEAHQQGREPHPHWDRLWSSPVVRIEDSEADGGADALSALGLRSALSLRLRADRRRITVLTAYASKPRAFDDAATRIGRLFTAHVSIALDSATTREQLTEAMRTRDLIGQATGILMERLNIDAAGAFESLVRASQRENVKLRDLARRIVDANDTTGGAGR
ncbi:GAF and ANTAR domain-containing protein [Streptomyces sp. S.PNR 29]|uniref:GAF and ANTAR domain-containing protein n=1 Tax=Streptomyces sp. S.PNR 29 TaxID=2973805 RepID=UPI0025B229AA|nr:GAF and ANTAR domain-containing protein [Streptomyces sp. S.PNR 29]MDN0199448.1 GAF and ANTAR domain-containing protein [Streptomyces sp. S.PNR 29]